MVIDIKCYPYHKYRSIIIFVYDASSVRTVLSTEDSVTRYLYIGVKTVQSFSTKGNSAILERDLMTFIEDSI